MCVCVCVRARAPVIAPVLVPVLAPVPVRACVKVWLSRYCRARGAFSREIRHAALVARRGSRYRRK
eukprot:5020250-Alexandrium_andersonii.AAC.1